MTASRTTPASFPTIAFIGGGNMASAIIGGLRQHGQPAEQILVVEPQQATREVLLAQHRVQAQPAADARLAQADVVVWAVKPQLFQQAAAPVVAWTLPSLHLSIAAGIPTRSLSSWLGSQRIVRAMPNTPALVGKGMTGLFALPQVCAEDRKRIAWITSAIGQSLWVNDEAQLDAVTALSGSGPAYVFYFLEAMRDAGVQMGLEPEQAYRLALATFEGGSALAAQSDESPEVLRQRVTSKGGTTFAATTTMDELGVKASFVQAMQAAQKRAQELGQELG